MEGSEAPCYHHAYQIIFQMNQEGIYEEKKICTFCHSEVKGY